jgi:MFS family permease
VKTVREPPPPRGVPPRWLNRTVAGAGVTSALGDLSYETTTVVLPGFLAALGVPAAALGFIEGVADAVSSFTRLFAGYVADKVGHRKALVLAGYAFTPIGQAAIAVAQGWPLVLVGRLVSWFGKGLRGPLRDAIVTQAVVPGTRSRAFGFHRAVDTIGAVVGPLVGVALLRWTQGFGWHDTAGPFRVVFWLTLVPGGLAVLAFLVLVRDQGHARNPALRFLTTLGGLPAGFRRYLGAVGLFSLGDFSHTLLILAATELLTPGMGVVQAAQTAGLLYVCRNAVQVVTSYPIGVLADRHGPVRVLVFGYVLGVLTATLMAAAFVTGADSLWVLGGVFALAGAYVAAQEALEPSVTASLVPADVLATSHGALGTVNGVGKFVSSTGVGLLWTLVSPVAAFAVAALLMAAGTLRLAAARRRDR